MSHSVKNNWENSKPKTMSRALHFINYYCGHFIAVNTKFQALTAYFLEGNYANIKWDKNGNPIFKFYGSHSNEYESNQKMFKVYVEEMICDKKISKKEIQENIKTWRLKV